MPASKHLEVVRISCDGRMRLEKIPLISVDQRGIDTNEWNSIEKEFECIPDMKSLEGSKTFSWSGMKSVKGSKTFSWSSRKLVGFMNNKADDEPWNDDYWMYLCLDKRAGLPHNKYLEELEGIERGPKYPMVPFDVYGDAFVFRTKSQLKKPVGLKGMEYIHMDQQFIDSAKTLKLEVGSWAFCILRELLVCPNML